MVNLKAPKRTTLGGQIWGEWSNKEGSWTPLIKGTKKAKCMHPGLGLPGPHTSVPIQWSIFDIFGAELSNDHNNWLYLSPIICVNTKWFDLSNTLLLYLSLRAPGESFRLHGCGNGCGERFQGNLTPTSESIKVRLQMGHLQLLSHRDSWKNLCLCNLKVCCWTSVVREAIKLKKMAFWKMFTVCLEVPQVDPGPHWRDYIFEKNEWKLN